MGLESESAGELKPLMRGDLVWRAGVKSECYMLA